MSRARLTIEKQDKGKGYFVEPTVLVNTKEDMKVVQEEIFGPVVNGHTVQQR